MSNIINNCVKNAVNTDIANILYFNTNEKFFEPISKSRHKFYINNPESNLITLENVSKYNEHYKIHYDLIAVDDTSSIFLHVQNLSRQTHIPNLLFLSGPSNLKLESLYLFIRDYKDIPKIFLNEESHKKYLSPKENTYIGFDKFDDIIYITCNKAYTKWK